MTRTDPFSTLQAQIDAEPVVLTRRDLAALVSAVEDAARAVATVNARGLGFQQRHLFERARATIEVAQRVIAAHAAGERGRHARASGPGEGDAAPGA